jgi:serine/threonine protein kinase
MSGHRTSAAAAAPKPSFLRREMTLKSLEIVVSEKAKTEGLTASSQLLMKRIQTLRQNLETVHAVPDDIHLESVTIPMSQEPIGRVRAVYDYLGRSEAELTFRKNDEIWLLQQTDGGWWFGSFDCREGYFPQAFVRILETFTKEPKKVPAKGAKTAVKDEESPRESEGDAPRKTKEEKKVELLENFQIGERIGKGQYGSVFRGINVENGEMVAIKQVGIAKMKRKEISLIMGELELLKELDHVNVMGYKGFIRTSEHINIVLDFVEGGSLSSILGKFGAIPERLAVCYIKQILEGLAYLHSRGVIHRDIKCGNVLVTKEGSIKLADFGIAMKLGDPSAPAVGSPYWMAPEVIELKGSGSACDIWALGCTIIELLTGSPPYFEFNQVQAMFCMVENERPPFPSNMSPEMESFLTCCFKRDPEERSTARQLRRHTLVRTEGEVSEDEDEDDDSSFDLAGLDDVNLEDMSTLDGLEAYGDLSNLDTANLNSLLDSLGQE